MNKPFSAHASAQTFRRMLFLAMLSAVILTVGLMLAGPSDPGTTIASRLMCTVALLAGLLSIRLGDLEKNVRYRVLLLLLSMWLVWTGLQEIVQTAFVHWLSVPPERSFYAAEFNHMIWTLTGLLLSGFIGADSVLTRASIVAKWFLALAAVLALWGMLWFPILEDPELLYKQALIRDFIAVDEYLAAHAGESPRPDARAIAERLSLPEWDGLERIGTLSGERNLSRIEEVLGYLEGPRDYVMMVLRPLNERDGWAAVLCVAFLGGALGVRIIRDRPESAFIEKIILLLFLIWVFEALHAFSFSLLRSLDVFRSVYGMGFLISAFFYLFLGFLLSRRMDFVMSIEGQYYERVLLRDAGSVTRWVDRFDQFILKRFLRRQRPVRRLFTLRDR